MNNFSQVLKKVLKTHWLAIVASILVGTIYIAPHIWFVVSNQDVYQDVPIMKTANEDFYIARMQEIVDNHILVGSTAYFEYKDQLPLQPPTIEFLYTLPTLLFGVPLVLTLLASRFILPALLSLIIYLLIYRLLEDKNELVSRLGALSGTLLILLGYDLVDYMSVLKYLSGETLPTNFLVWSRPVNPVAGGILLFSFFHLLFSIIQPSKKTTPFVFGSGILLGLMFSSYFFSWGIALSSLAILGSVYFFVKNYKKLISLIYVIFIGLTISIPYWYFSFITSKSEWYEDSLLRSGLFYTHIPIPNKFLLFTLFIFLTSLFYRWLNEKESFNFRSSDLFIFISLFGGLFAFNQQIITGMTVWPFHFVQYTIPLSILALVSVLFNFISKYPRVYMFFVTFFIIVLSIGYGVFVQYQTYVTSLEENRQIQKYSEVFEYLNSKEKDCVVLVNAERKEFNQITGLILSFTHCNVYNTTWNFSLVPEDRIIHSYFINLRMKGVTIDQLDEYLSAYQSELRSYLFTNWAGLYQKAIFTDFEDRRLVERTSSLEQDYKKFLEQDLQDQLSKYRLDYIFSVGPLDQDILNQLSTLEISEAIHNVSIYKYSD